MSELSWYVSPIDVDDLNNADETVASMVVPFRGDEKIFELGFDIAILSCFDGDNSLAEEIRKSLFDYYAHFKLKICDLGNLKKGNTKKDSEHAFKFVSNFLLEKQVAVLCFGLDSSEQSIYISDFCSPYEMTYVDCSIDAVDGLLDNNRIGPISIIGLQNFLCPPSKLQRSIGGGNIHYRLGDVTENISSVEPALRDSKYCLFSMNSIVNSIDFNAGHGSPNGISNHSACQIAYYFGRSPHATLFAVDHVGEIQPIYRNRYISLQAQLLWHFILGWSQKIKYVSGSKTYKSYYLTNIDLEGDFCFCEDALTGAWWLEVSFDSRKLVLSSSAREHEMMMNGSIPERIILALKKL